MAEATGVSMRKHSSAGLCSSDVAPQVPSNPGSGRMPRGWTRAQKGQVVSR